jgi:ectoine hydroxylase-related dioxygenase (phytanoyl-CoA dioxygenase family)
MPPSSDIKPQRQPTHSDADFTHPPLPFALVVNVPLISMSPENGSTEVWLGTHTGTGPHHQEGAHGERASGRIKLDLLESRKKVSPPIQPVIPKGSIIVRDLRLWHGGMPNMSSDVRVMLAFSMFSRIKMTVANSPSTFCTLVQKSNACGIW